MPSSAFQTSALDRKSTRLNSSHTLISYAVFCLKKNTRLQLVLRHCEGGERRVRIPQWSRRDPRLNRRPELLAKALEVEVGEQHVLPRVSIDPGRERRNVDLGLGLRKTLRPGREDAGPVGAAGRLRLLSVPATRLVTAPGGSNGRDREQQRRHEVEALLCARALRCHVFVRTPSRSQGIRTFAARFGSTSSTSRRLRFIAVGLSPPTPPWNG